MTSSIEVAKNKKYLLILLSLSLLTHFLFFGHPKETVFDEVHFGKFASGYITGQHYFDIHPPLGKLMISGIGYLGGFRPGFSFANIGEKFPDKSYLWLRLLPILAGTLLPIVIYLIASELGFSVLASFVAALLIVFENSILVQSLFMLLDSFLLLFGFLGLLFYLQSKNKHHKYPNKLLILSAIFLTLALSIKWTGASFLAIILIYELISLINTRSNFYKTFLKVAQRFVIFVIIPFTIYFLIFWAHFHLLPKSGPGDAFMSPSFQKTLISSAYKNDTSIKEAGLFQKFTELNIEMYRSNKRLVAAHPYSSKWYTWPFMIRPIYYWNHLLTDGKESKIYFIGNPFIYWISSIAILILLFNAFSKIFKNKKSIVFFLGGGYLINLLPFIQIGRVMFLYHYFVSLIFAVLSLCFLLDQIHKKDNKKIAFTAIISISIALFVYFAPLTYGLPLTQKEYNSRVWLNSWR